MAHRLGLDAPPSGATKGSEVVLKKWPLRAEEVAELELFADAAHAADAEALAKKFRPLWDKYIAVGDAVTVSDAGGVKVEIGKQSSPGSPAGSLRRALRGEGLSLRVFALGWVVVPVRRPGEPESAAD